MPFQGDLLYRTAEQVLAALITKMQARIVDVWVEDDSTLRILFTVISGEIEGVYLANQILRDNIFVTTANFPELRRHGDVHGVAMKTGTPSSGTLKFRGAGGTTIPVGMQVAADSGVGDPLYYETTSTGTIPNPGQAGSPAASLNGAAGNLMPGNYEYRVTFVTAAGETVPGGVSNVITVAQATTGRIDLSALPVGGAGAVSKRIYRQQDGGGYKLVTTLDNVILTYQDNVAAGSLGVAPPTVDSAHAVFLSGQSEKAGTTYNVPVGTILVITGGVDGVSGVENTTAFTGASNDEDFEEYRTRLLRHVRNPKSGSPADLESWAEEIEGIDKATAFVNDNMGVPAPGHVTMRLAAPNGGVPSLDLLNTVAEMYRERNIATITMHVTTFTPVPTNVTVVITLESGTTYTLADVTPTVQSRIQSYIDSLPVGGTVRRSGIVDAVFGDIPGVADVDVTVPATNQTTTAIQKRVAGVITVL